jgi:predicted dehydrogenase
MEKKYRLGIIGFAHMHINHLVEVFASHPQVQWVAYADTIPACQELRQGPYTRAWNIDHLHGVTGRIPSYSDYHDMLEREQFDIVLTCAENAQHADVVEACAATGVHVCVEKPMAASLSESLRMVRASQAAGTRLLINWPTTWYANTRKIKDLLDEGAIGRVLEVKFRGGHTGPLGPGNRHPGVAEETARLSGIERGATWWHQAATGGGVMLDYCCYGAMYSHWYIGEQAVAVVGLKANLNSPWGEAEDNAAMLVRFPSAMALVEGSWTTWHQGVSAGLIVYGTDGTLVMDYEGDKVRLERGHGDSTLVDCPPLPAEHNNIAKEFIYHLETGQPVHPTLDMLFNLKAMAILDAGVRSAASGKQELVNNEVWQIG